MVTTRLTMLITRLITVLICRRQQRSGYNSDPYALLGVRPGPLVLGVGATAPALGPKARPEDRSEKRLVLTRAITIRSEWDSNRENQIYREVFVNRNEPQKHRL